MIASSVLVNGEELKSSRSNERRSLLLLLGGCAALLVLSLGLNSFGTIGRSSEAGLRLGDAAEAQIVEIRDHRGVAVMSGEFRTRQDSLSNTEKDAALMDRQGRRVLGEVEVEIPAPGREDRRPELEVDIIGLPANETFTVAIDDRQIASFTTDDRGSIDVELQEGELLTP